jgi:hypothetical protein
VRAEVRSLHLEPDPRTLPEDPAQFSFLARLSVGPQGEPGEEMFDVQVCSPEWLACRCETEGFIGGRHTVVTTVAGYSEEGLFAFLARRVEQVSGETWQEMAAKVARLGHWEFEDYTG